MEEEVAIGTNGVGGRVLPGLKPTAIHQVVCLQKSVEERVTEVFKLLVQAGFHTGFLAGVGGGGGGGGGLGACSRKIDALRCFLVGFCLGAEAPRHSAGYVYVCPRPRAI